MRPFLGKMRLIFRKIGVQQKLVLLVVGGLLALYVIQAAFLQGKLRKRLADAVGDGAQTGGGAKALGEDPLAKKENAVKTTVSDVKSDGGDTICQQNCEGELFSYKVVSGEGLDVKPYICYKDSIVLSEEKKNFGRGLNIVQINDITEKIIDIKIFDTFMEDADFVSFLGNLPNHHVVLIACYDECARKLSADGRQLLEKFGSKSINELQFRDSFVMLGQKGLKSGLAVEKVNQKGTKEFGDQAQIKGCSSFPIAELSPVVEEPKKPAKLEGAIEVGKVLADCGMVKPCPTSHFPAHVYTGKDHNDEPKICVSNKYVVKKNINNSGRGLNFVVVDHKKGSAKHVAHFDTYAEDSSSLEIFLESLQKGDIIVGISFDDSSRRLSDLAKQLLNELGSSQIQNLKFRSSWYIVTQKGLGGYTPFEHLEYSVGNQWSKAIDKQMCVPYEIVGQAVAPDPPARSNSAKRDFCIKHEGYGDFCSEKHLDDPILPAPLTNMSLESNPIYSTPILVVAGMSSNALRMTLETLIMQPGIKTDKVLVAYDEKFSDALQLVTLFGFKSVQLTGSKSYRDSMQKALEKAFAEFPKENYLMVLEEELILSPDFLYYMAQVFPLLERDDSLLAVSAWNFNGYKGSSGDNTLAYRVEEFPGLAFILRRSTYVNELKPRMETCCHNRSWDGWLAERRSDREIVVPDFSRVFRRVYEGLGAEVDFLEVLFNRPRITNLEPRPWIGNIPFLTKATYEVHVQNLLKTSNALQAQPGKMKQCASETQKAFNIPDTKKKVYAIYYEGGEKTLRFLCSCFHLFALEGHRSRGMHKGMLRFTFQQNSIFLIGSTSPYFVNKPNLLQPFRLSGIT